MNMIRSQSGQSMLPIVLTAAALLTGLMVSLSGLTTNTQAVKTSQVTVESDMFENSVYQVLNSEGSCAEVFLHGDGTTPIPYRVDATHAPGVYRFVTGLSFTGPPVQPFLTYANAINSLNLVQPSLTEPNPFRIDPSGFINYGGPQPVSLLTPFSGTNCSLVNLHVETQSSATMYGLKTRKFDFPIYIGVRTVAPYDIMACQGASVGPPCVINPTPAIVLGANPTCRALGSTYSYTWTQTNTAYVVIQPTVPAGPAITVAAPPVTLTLPTTAPPGGAIQYTITPYGADGVAAAAQNFMILTNAPAAMVSETPGAGTISWVADANTVQVNVSPGTLHLGSTGTQAAVPGLYNFTPFNSCLSPGPTVPHIYP